MEPIASLYALSFQRPDAKYSHDEPAPRSGASVAIECQSEGLLLIAGCVCLYCSIQHLQEATFAKKSAAINTDNDPRMALDVALHDTLEDSKMQRIGVRLLMLITGSGGA
jgi:hypothetical protein